MVLRDRGGNSGSMLGDEVSAGRVRAPMTPWLCFLNRGAHLRIFERNVLGDWPQPGPCGSIGRLSLLPDPSRSYERKGISALVILTSKGSNVDDVKQSRRIASMRCQATAVSASAMKSRA